MGERWAGSMRKAQLPRNWREIRARILERDGGRCTWTENGQRCGAPATDVDHIVRGMDHNDANLRSLCGPHHRYKTAREGSAAGNAARWSTRTTRPTERHPGLR